MFDLSADRDRRREQQGYVPPAEARAFLDVARRPATAGTVESASSVARAYFRSLDEPSPVELPADAGEADAGAEGVAAVVEVLIDSGVLAPSDRALLAGSVDEAPRLARIHAALRVVVERDPDLYAHRSGELGYLANTLVSGCSHQGRSFTPQEASDAVLAVCNLGLEHWEAGASDDVLVAHDLVAVFQVGWAMLYEKVGLTAARRLIEVLTLVQPHDRDTQIGLTRLRRELTKHVKAGMPWRARGSLDVIADLDLLAWTGLVGLLDECPVIHAAVRASSGPRPLTVSPTAFDFISEDADIASVQAFLTVLPETLSG
jgi:hypothetical protein